MKIKTLPTENQAITEADCVRGQSNDNELQSQRCKILQRQNCKILQCHALHDAF
jgi:hypothetical protein